MLFEFLLNPGLKLSSLWTMQAGSSVSRIYLIFFAYVGQSVFCPVFVIVEMLFVLIRMRLIEWQAKWKMQDPSGKLNLPRYRRETSNYYWNLAWILWKYNAVLSHLTSSDGEYVLVKNRKDLGNALLLRAEKFSSFHCSSWNISSYLCWKNRNTVR